MDKIKKTVFLFLGLILTFLGIIGIFIPVLPTTPLLLLASYCYVRSSEKLYLWLINHRIFGRYIRDYNKYRAVDKKSKTIAVILIWVSMMVSMSLISKTPVRIVLLITGLAVTYFISTIKTLTPELKTEMDSLGEA